jgi:hypothetical protein
MHTRKHNCNCQKDSRNRLFATHNRFGKLFVTLAVAGIRTTQKKYFPYHPLYRRLQPFCLPGFRSAPLLEMQNEEGDRVDLYIPRKW